MPDEASTHYTAILDQMMEGHLWIAETLGMCSLFAFFIVSAPLRGKEELMLYPRRRSLCMRQRSRACSRSMSVSVSSLTILSICV